MPRCDTAEPDGSTMYYVRDPINRSTPPPTPERDSQVE